MATTVASTKPSEYRNRFILEILALAHGRNVELLLQGQVLVADSVAAYLYQPLGNQPKG